MTSATSANRKVEEGEIEDRSPPFPLISASEESWKNARLPVRPYGFNELSPDNERNKSWTFETSRLLDG